jgi:hypothetical protein
LSLFMGRVYTRPPSSKRSGRSATTMPVHLGYIYILWILRAQKRSVVSSESSNREVVHFEVSHHPGEYGGSNPHYAGRWLKASPDAELKIQQRQPDASLEKEYCGPESSRNGICLHIIPHANWQDDSISVIFGSGDWTLG